MVNALQDGLNLPDLLDTAAIQTAEIGSGGVMGPNISGGVITNAHLGAGVVSGTAIASGCITNYRVADNACSGTKLSPEVGLIQTGSPLYGAQVMVHGTNTITGSPNFGGWIAFAKAFGAAPIIVNLRDNVSGLDLVAGTVGAGSFQVSNVADGNFSGTIVWLAAGSGRI